MNLRRLSASQITNADNCRRLHWYRSILKVTTTTTAANLEFGKAIDVSVRDYLMALSLGKSLPDPVDSFEKLWKKARDENELSYSSTQTPAIFTKMGKDLMSQFPGAWEKTGYQVVIDINGKPLLDLKLRCTFGTRVLLDGVIDVVVYTPEGILSVVDIKTAATSHSDTYTVLSDQLTVYQLLIAAHAKRLGIPKAEQLGFFDFLKRKASSRIDPPIVSRIRTHEEIVEFRQKCEWLAEDIHRGRFPKSPRVAFNTPCDMCDFSGLCAHGDTEGLIIPDQHVQLLKIA